MNGTTTLSLQLAKQLVSCPPKNDKEKNALLHTLQQLERLTASGIKYFTKHWSEWRLGCGLPLDGVKEVDSSSLKALFRSGTWFSLGLTQLTVDQAKQLASLTSTCTVRPTVGLTHLESLPYEIAEILMLHGQTSYRVSGHALIDEQTLALLLSPNNNRVVLIGLSRDLALCLRNLPPHCSLTSTDGFRNIIACNYFADDKIAGYLSESVPWFDKKRQSFYHVSTILDGDGNRRLLRRIGATIPILSFHVSQHFHPAAIKVLLGSESRVKSLHLELRTLPRELAEALLVIEHKPSEKILINVTETVSDEVAAILAQFNGALEIRVSDISVPAAEMLLAANKIDPAWALGKARKNIRIAQKNLKASKDGITIQISESDIAEFEKTRKTIAEILPLGRLAKRNRFVSRLRESKREIAQILSEVKEMCDDDDAVLISEFLKHPPSWDRNLSIKLTESSEPVDLEKVGDSLIDCGCYAAFGAYSSEDHLYEFTATGGQTWIDELFAELAKEKPKPSEKLNWDVSRHLCYTERESVEIVICGGQVRILACGPERGSKWTNYEVIPREICDFLNVILFGRGYLAMYIEVEEYWGFFAIISREAILDVLGKMKTRFKSAKLQSDAEDRTKQQKSSGKSASDCRGKQEKLGGSRSSNLVKNESKLRNSKARKKPAKKKAQK